MRTVPISRYATAGTVLLLAAVPLGCGSSTGRPGAPRARQTASIQVSSARCSTSWSRRTGTVVQPCVLTLSDGRRFSCPESFSGRPESPAALEHATACKRLAPLRIPSSWRPALAAIERTRSCLIGHGLSVIGGPALGLDQRPDGPVGELDIPRRHALPIMLGFYRDSVAARRFLPKAAQSVKPSGGRVTRRAEIIVFWPRGTTSAQRLGAVPCLPSSPTRP